MGARVLRVAQVCVLLQDSVNGLHGVFGVHAPHTSQVTQIKVGRRALAAASQAMPHMTMAMTAANVCIFLFSKMVCIVNHFVNLLGQIH